MMKRNSAKKALALILAVVMLFDAAGCASGKTVSGSGGTAAVKYEAGGTKAKTISSAELVSNTETDLYGSRMIEIEDEALSASLVINDGKIYHVSSMLRMLNGAAIEITSGALYIDTGIRLDSDITVSGSGLLLNFGEIHGSILADASETDDAVCTSLGLWTPMNVLNYDGSMEQLTAEGSSIIHNYGKISRESIGEGFIGEVHNDGGSTIDYLLCGAAPGENGTVINTAYIREAELHSEVWNGHTGVIDFVTVYDGGMCCNHDGGYVREALVRGGYFSNEQGFSGNLWADYTEYRLSRVDTITVDIEEGVDALGLFNNGYIRTLTALNGNISTTGCIDYAFCGSGASFYYENDEAHAERSNRESNDLPIEAVFKRLMSEEEGGYRNGIFWEFSEMRDDPWLSGTVAVDTIYLNGQHFHAENAAVNNLFAVGYSSAEFTQSSDIALLYRDRHSSGINIISSGFERSEVSAPSVQGEPASFGGGSQALAESISGITIAQSVSKAFDRWYRVDLEKYASLDITCSCDSVGLVLLYSPEGEISVFPMNNGTVKTGRVATEKGKCYVRVIGAPGNYSLTVSKEAPNFLSGVIRGGTGAAPGSLAYRLSDFRLTVVNRTTGEAVDGLVFDGEKYLYAPNLASDGDILSVTAAHKNGTTADGHTLCTVEDGAADFALTVLLRGSLYASGAQEDVYAYLFNSEGGFERALTAANGSYYAGTVPAGDYTLLLTRGYGSYCFPSLFVYADQGLREGAEYILYPLSVADGEDTYITADKIPQEVNASHPSLDAAACSLTMTPSEAAADSLIQVTLRYGFTEGATPDKLFAKFICSDHASFAEGSMMVDGTACEAEDEDNTITVPLTETSGTVSFYMRPVGQDGRLVVSSWLGFDEKGAGEEAIIGTASASVSSLTINAPTGVSGSVIPVWGYGSADKTVYILNNGEEIASTLCGSGGYWYCEVPVSEGTSLYSLSASAEGFTTEIIYTAIDETLPQLLNYAQYYSLHGHIHKVEISGDSIGKQPVSVNYLPGEDFEFSLHFSDSQRVSDVYVCTERDGTEYALEAQYSPDTDRWDAAGSFSDDERFVPGSIYIRYSVIPEAESYEPATDEALSESTVTEAELTEIRADADVSKMYYDADYTLSVKTENGETAEIPLAYSSSVRSLEDPKAQLTAENYIYCTSDEDGNEYYYRFDEDTDTGAATVSMAIVTPATDFQDPDEIAEALVEALNNDLYSDALARAHISEAEFDDMLQNKDELLPQLERYLSLSEAADLAMESEDEAAYDEISSMLDEEDILSLIAHSGGEGSSTAGSGLSAVVVESLRIAEDVGDRFLDFYFHELYQNRKEYEQLQADMKQNLKYQDDINMKLYEMDSDADMQKRREYQSLQNELEKQYAEMKLHDEYMKTLALQYGLTELMWVGIGLSVSFVKPISKLYSYAPSVPQASKNLYKLSLKLLKSMDLLEVDGRRLRLAVNNSFKLNKFEKAVVYVLNEMIMKMLQDIQTLIAFEPLAELIRVTEEIDKQKIKIPITHVPDPSGYVYEAVDSNRLEGVAAIAYWKNADGEEVFWNSAQYGQENPLFTDTAGFYQWYVPEGEWKVRFEKDGYAPCETEWLPVPPPQTEVNVGLTSYDEPNMSAYIHRDSIELVFDKYMDAESVTGAVFRLIRKNGRARDFSVEAVNAEEAADGSGRMLATRFAAYKIGGASGREYSIGIPTGLYSYSGTEISTKELSFTAVPAVRGVSVDDSITLEAGGVIRIPFYIDCEGLSTGLSVSCSSEANGFVRILDITGHGITGYTVITVETDRTGSVPLYLSIDGTGFEKTIEANVVKLSGSEDVGEDILRVSNRTLDTKLLIFCTVSMVLLASGAAVFAVIVRKRRTAAAMTPSGHRRTEA